MEIVISVILVLGLLAACLQAIMDSNTEGARKNREVFRRIREGNRKREQEQTNARHIDDE